MPEKPFKLTIDTKQAGNIAAMECAVKVLTEKKPVAEGAYPTTKVIPVEEVQAQAPSTSDTTLSSGNKRPAEWEPTEEKPKSPKIQKTE